MLACFGDRLFSLLHCLHQQRLVGLKCHRHTRPTQMHRHMCNTAYLQQCHAQYVVQGWRSGAHYLMEYEVCPELCSQTASVTNPVNTLSIHVASFWHVMLQSHTFMHLSHLTNSARKAAAAVNHSVAIENAKYSQLPIYNVWWPLK